MSQARNSKTHPGLARSCGHPRAPCGAGSPGELTSPFREATRTHNSGRSGEKLDALPPAAHPSARDGGPSWRGPAPLTGFPGAVAPRRQLVHLHAGAAALQHRQAPLRAAHLARRLGPAGQRAAELRGAGEEPQRRVLQLRRGPGPGGRLALGGRPRLGGRTALGGRPGLGGRQGCRARAAPRPPRRSLLHRRLSPAPRPRLGSAGLGRRRRSSRRRGKRTEGNHQTRSATCERSRRADRWAASRNPGRRRPRPRPRARPRADADTHALFGGGARRPGENRKGVLLRGRGWKRKRKGN